MGIYKPLALSFGSRALNEVGRTFESNPGEGFSLTPLAWTTASAGFMHHGLHMLT